MKVCQNFSPEIVLGDHRDSPDEDTTGRIAGYINLARKGSETCDPFRRLLKNKRASIAMALRRPFTRRSGPPSGAPIVASGHRGAGDIAPVNRPDVKVRRREKNVERSGARKESVECGAAFRRVFPQISVLPWKIRLTSRTPSLPTLPPPLPHVPRLVVHRDPDTN